MVAKGEGRGSGMDGDLGFNTCKLLHLEWISNESYCIAQGTIASLLGQTMMERNIKKNVSIHTHTCVTESLCYTAEIGTTL